MLLTATAPPDYLEKIYFLVASLKLHFQEHFTRGWSLKSPAQR